MDWLQCLGKGSQRQEEVFSVMGRGESLSSKAGGNFISQDQVKSYAQRKNDWSPSEGEEGNTVITIIVSIGKKKFLLQEKKIRGAWGEGLEKEGRKSRP